MFSRMVNKVLLLLLMSIIGHSVFAQKQAMINANDIALDKEPLREKIFAHTDKDFYVAGEILWFKLYSVDADSLKPLDLSNVAYVEIINLNQKPVLQATVALNNGSGSGSFYLTSSLTSGNYIFRAYTNWMKNFEADAYFQKQITVVNTLTQLAKPPGNDSNNYEIGFFPEGGNLVTNIESKVGFKVTDNSGNGITCSGKIVDENDKSVASFSTFKFGMGSFYFTPTQHHTYKAVITINGKKITKALPDVNDKGYVMHLSGADENQVTITVKSGESNKPVYLLAYSNSNVKAALMQTTKDGVAVFTLNKNNLSGGISHLTVFDSEKQPVCERLIFFKPQPLQLNVTADKEMYDARSEVQLNVNTSDSVDLSMAVYLLDSLQPEDENNIVNYLLLTSVLKGSVESPQYYFSNPGKDADSALDNLLLTQGWSRFKSGSTQSIRPLFRFAPEREGHIIEGHVTDKTSGLPAANIRVYLSVPGRHFRFANAVSNDSGKVFFDIKDFYGSGELIVQTGRGDSMYRVEIADPFSNNMSGWDIPQFSFPENRLKQLSQRNLGMQVQNAYLINKLNRFNSPALDTNAFYGKPDAVYYLDNYVRFNTMEEVLREYIAGVDVRLRQGNYSLRAVDPRNHTIFENNPLVLVDGVPIFDINKVIAYNPLKIKRADVLMRKYYINSLVTDGIVSYSTYNGDLDGFQFDPGTIELSYNGLQLEREFYSPQYATAEAKESRLPDYRNVLYWLPDVKRNDQLSFYTSDVKGKYVAVIQGVSISGKVGYAATRFEVK
ncbi:MAG TPA: hypothetical protein VFW07_08020 [Parafilimonas sp.]|nr:hypothetical protein [Parafilimonas sp.]